MHGTFYDLVNNAFNSLNYPKKDVIEALENDGTIVDGMDLVIKKLFTTHDIIIITGSDYETVKLFMAKHNLLTFVKKIYGRPARVNDNGKIILGEVNSLRDGISIGCVLGDCDGVEDDLNSLSWCSSSNVVLVLAGSAI